MQNQILRRMAHSPKEVTDQKVPFDLEILLFRTRAGRYSLSGFAIPLELAEIRLGLSVELNSASNGTLSEGGYRSKSTL